MTIVWMTVVGALIGLVASMFVAGKRETGLGATTLLGAASYLFGGLTGPLWGASTSVQWTVAILLGATVITVYLIYRTRKEVRRENSRRP